MTKREGAGKMDVSSLPVGTFLLAYYSDFTEIGRVASGCVEHVHIINGSDDDYNKGLWVNQSGDGEVVVMVSEVVPEHDPRYEVLEAFYAAKKMGCVNADLLKFITEE